MKRIHVFQHVPFETPGCILNWAMDMGYPVTYTRFFEGETPPPEDSMDWLIIMGGPMSVHDTELYPWLAEEKVAILSAINSGRTVIGICLGSQLIAEALGGGVKNNGEKEIGWHRIFRTGESNDGGLFDVIPDGVEVFHWHGETFDVPRGSEHGVYSDCCRNQAFLYGDRVLGLQFHLEVTPHLLHEMIENCREELVESAYVQSEEKIIEGMKYIRESNSIMYSILDRLDYLP